MSPGPPVAGLPKAGRGGVGKGTAWASLELRIAGRGVGAPWGGGLAGADEGAVDLEPPCDPRGTPPKGRSESRRRGGREATSRRWEERGGEVRRGMGWGGGLPEGVVVGGGPLALLASSPPFQTHWG